MSGGVEPYVEAMQTRQFRAVAMSVFASGAIPAREAIEWVCGLPNLNSIVFGASSRANIVATRAAGRRVLAGGSGEVTGLDRRPAERARSWWPTRPPTSTARTG